MKSSTTTNRGIRPDNGAESARKEGLMASTFEFQVREFAAEFDTPSVRQMVALCEAGRITWAQAYEISRKALANGIAAVA